MKEVREERRREGEGRRVYGGRGEEGASPPDRGLLGPPVYVYLHLKTPKKPLPQVVGESKGGKEGTDRGLLGPPVYLHLKTPKKTLPQVVGEGKGGKEGRREEDRQQRLR